MVAFMRSHAASNAQMGIEVHKPRKISKPLANSSEITSLNIVTEVSDLVKCLPLKGPG